MKHAEADMMTPHVPAEQIVKVQAGAVSLDANLWAPEAARGIVVFAHGSGSSRYSPRNRFVASALHQKGLATLLFDLLTAEEGLIDERTARMRFDIQLLARRLQETIDWLTTQEQAARLSIGLFGASTGGAAALAAAAERPDLVRAVVSRGGRPDLARGALARVHAPTLLIVGEEDRQVIAMNREAMAQMRATQPRLEIVAGATHLFEEPGALEEVASLAGRWFEKHLA
jgi:putative phosphoribosyl transferase